MTDFSLLAKARGLDLAADTIERQAAVLSSLEAAFEQLKRRIPPDAEPAPVFVPLSPGREGSR